MTIRATAAAAWARKLVPAAIDHLPIGDGGQSLECHDVHRLSDGPDRPITETEVGSRPAGMQAAERIEIVKGDSLDRLRRVHGVVLLGKEVRPGPPAKRLGRARGRQLSPGPLA